MFYERDDVYWVVASFQRNISLIKQDHSIHNKWVWLEPRSHNVTKTIYFLQWKEVKPGTTRFLAEGTRVCAFWSQQYRALYPGMLIDTNSFIFLLCLSSVPQECYFWGKKQPKSLYLSSYLKRPLLCMYVFPTYNSFLKTVPNMRFLRSSVIITFFSLLLQFLIFFFFSWR